MPVTAVRDEGALRMWVCRLPVHIDPAECTVLYGNLRRIRNFPAGRCGHRPLRSSGQMPRVYLKTPNAPGQRAFLRCAASFFLEIRQYSCEKMSCATQKSLAAGHIMSFQIHPKQTACKTSALSERMRKTQNGPAIWSALRLSVWRFA